MTSLSMSNNKKNSESNIRIHMDNDDTLLFPYAFVFRNREQLNEYISTKLTSNIVFHRVKVFMGPFTLILPMLNFFMVYRSLIYQREDFADAYSIFHSIIFYGEFTMVHVLLIGTFIIFLYKNLRDPNSLCFSKGKWIILLDLEFTLMAFNMIKLIPILSLNGFNFLMTEISICAPIFLKYTYSTQVVCFTILVLLIILQTLTLVGSLLLLNLVKVYQVSFVGQVKNPLSWKIDQWLLFIGFAANIVNITDTPTITQLAFMWDLTNKTWSSDTNMWFHDQFGAKRKTYIIDQIYQKLGFIKAFLWVRTMSAIDVHTLIRLPPSTEQSSEDI